MRLPATLTVATRAGRRIIDHAVVVWGRLWPGAPKPNVPPPPRPVKLLRPSRYQLQVSVNRRRWQTVADVGARRRTTDVLEFPAVRARWVRVRVLGGTGVMTTTTVGSTTKKVRAMPLLQELTVNR